MIRNIFLLLALSLFMNSGYASCECRARIVTGLAKVIITSVEAPDVDGGMDKDPNKCICKGTGIVVHGDGHTTKCVYHGKGDIGEAPKVEVTPFIQSDTGQCWCDDCDCNDCGCLTGDCPCDDGKAAKETKDETMVATTVKKKYDYILYHLGADWCGPCKAMLRNVWPRVKDDKSYNDDMKKFLEENKIRLIILDETHDKDKPYFKYYKKYINGRYPTVLAVSVNDYNTPLFIRNKSADKKSMMRVLKEFVDGQQGG